MHKLLTADAAIFADEPLYIRKPFGSSAKIDFHAIASAKHNALLCAFQLTNFFHKPNLRINGEGKLFSYFNIRAFMVNAYTKQISIITPD